MLTTDNTLKYGVISNLLADTITNNTNSTSSDTGAKGGGSTGDAFLR